MMQPRKVEYTENGHWVQVKVKLGVSRNGNYTFMHLGQRYVFKNFLEGTEVLVLRGSFGWVKVGRIDRYGTIVLGTGESYGEMIDRQNKGKTSEQLMSEIKSFLHPDECPPLDRTQKTIDSLKNVPKEVVL